MARRFEEVALNTQHSAVRTRSRVLPIALLAGTLAAFSGANEARAINDARGFLDWSDWSSVGIRGNGVVIANIDGGHALSNHVSFGDRLILQLSWPFDSSGQITGIVNGTRNWEFNHATAVASSMIAQGSITGIAPDASLISASFASGINPNNGNFEDVTPDAIAFPMFTLSDPALADDVADALGLPDIPVASVINISFGTQTASGRRTEDTNALIANAIASVYDQTLIAAVGNDAEDSALDSQNLPSMMNEGTARSPAAALNTISVGFLEDDFNGVNDDSGGGVLPVFEYFVAANLGDPDADPDPFFPPPTELEIFNARVGVDLVAPGTSLRLASSPVDQFDAPGVNSFSDFWTGSSFASGIVSGAAALVHQFGNENDLWALGRPSGLVTRAVLMNSAQKGPAVNFNNFASDGMFPRDNVWVTSQGLDEEVGAGALDLERLFNQFALADTKDVTTLAGFRPDATGATTVPSTSGTDPEIPFSTVPGQPPEGISIGSSLDTRDRDPAAVADRRSMSRSALDDSFLIVQERIASEFASLRSLQFGDNPDLGGGVVVPPFGGATDPAPGSPFRLPDDGQIDPPDLPGAPGGDRFRTGWDHGNLGRPFIDIPIGTITAGSTVTLTLCWYRTETWNVPNYDGPLNLISPTLVVPPQFLDGLQPAREAVATPERVEFDVESNPQVPAGGAQILDTRYSVQWPDVGCGLTGHRGHAPAPRRGGEPELRHMSAEQVEARLDDIFSDLSSKAGQGWTYEQLKKQVGPGVEVQPRGAGPAEIELIFDGSISPTSPFAIVAQAAADRWEELIDDPVTVRIQIGLVNIPNGFLAAATRSIVGVNYDPLRDLMIMDASSQEEALLNQLPVEMSAFPMSFRFGSGQTLTSADLGMIDVTRANAKALGIAVPPVPEQGDIDGQIVINTAQDILWDFDRSDGISAGHTDLFLAMLHEYGHTMGFVSGTDDVDRGFDPTATTLDFFRFSNGLSPNTTTNFQRFFRELRPGGEAAFDVDIEVNNAPIIPEITDSFRFSTGANMGDGRQASHWKDDFLTTQYIGVMDPTLAAGAFIVDPITRADLLAFGLIGWDTDFLEAEPPDEDPSQVPRIAFEPSFGGDSPLVDPEPRFEFEFEDVNLELWRFGGGTGNQLVAVSESVENNVEHIVVGGPEGGGEDRLPLANYFIRIRHVGTRVDFGGYVVNPAVESIPVPGYNDLSPGNIQYGLAWYIDLALAPGDILEGAPDPADLSGDGVVNSTDLAVLLSMFGGSGPDGDINRDGRIDSKDLAMLLGKFGR